MKTKLLFTALAVAMVVLNTGCKKDDFVEIVGVCPLVVSTSPTNGETNVALNKVVTATFNEVMNPSTITQASFTLQSGASVAGVVTYSGQTASFTPASPLAINTTYSGRIKTLVKDLNGNSLQTDYVWIFSTGATLVPMVVATDPADNETGVVLNKVIIATFSESMDPATINATTFTLKHGSTAVPGTISYSGTNAFFVPTNPLILDSVYTGTITSGAKNLIGTAIAGNYVWTFSTGNLSAPYVTSTVPANNDINVPLNQVLSATFSEAMDAATINTTSFRLMQGLAPVPGTVLYSGTVASFNPDAPLLPNVTYTATITRGAQNLAGTAMANDYVWTFRTIYVAGPTVIATDPINYAGSVPLNKVLSATFNEPMTPSTVNASTFTLRTGTTVINGTVTYSNGRGYFTPSSPLSAATTYTATVTTGVKNLAGTPMAVNHVWYFSTAGVVAPTVISTDPVNNATLVPLNKVVTATFSEPMDPSTITSWTFTLKQGFASVPGVVTYSGNTASFTPSANLSSGNTYTATITTGARSMAGVALVSNYVWNFSTVDPLGPQPPVDLASAERFGILAGVGISNNAGFSEIRNLDVGISPGVRSSVTGFPPAIVVNGAIYCSDDAAPPGVAAMLIQAKQDLTDAYLMAEGASSPAPATVSGDIGGTTLAPGIYKSTSTLMIQSGSLTLDAQGDANATWIFQIASDFTTVGGAGGNVILSGGAQAKNVFWQVGASATIGDFTSFKGNVLALTSITMNSGATAEGRMLARNGAVVMTSTNIINRP